MSKRLAAVMVVVGCATRSPGPSHLPPPASRERVSFINHPLDAVSLAWRTRSDDRHERIWLTAVVEYRDYEVGIVVGDDDVAASSAERCTSEPDKTDARAAAFYCGGSYASFVAELIGHELVITRSDSYYDASNPGGSAGPAVVVRVPVRGTQLIVEPYGPDSVTHAEDDP